MKKLLKLSLCAVMLLSLVFMTGCASSEAPATPPPEVLHPDGASAKTGAYTATMLEGAVTVRIGHEGVIEWPVDMFDNDAVHTMLNYVSGSLLFPTYTYEEDPGFVAQRISGSYSREDEVLIPDIQAGELYLFSGNQLRLYFKDVPGANITATPVGRFRALENENITDTVINSYNANRDDYWGVDVYFIITNHLN